MEPFVVSARKYRPQTFKDVVGQQAITDTLENAIANNHLAQALLFCGPRGVGKTTCARILAKKINQDGNEREDEDFAFNIFELDAASNNSVDDIRSLTDQVRIPPQVGKYKVYIIDEVHMLSQSAFNAFLKTLEEPPKHAIFILATTEKHKIIPTILSRCQIFDFKRITVKDAANYLKYIADEQGITAEDDALHIIAQKADGAMRDALSIFDRVVSFSGKNLTRRAVTENLNVLDYDTFFTTTDLVLENKIPELLLLFNDTLALGFDGHHFVTGLASHFRDLMVCQHQSTITLLEVGENAKAKYAAQSKLTSRDFLLKALDTTNDCDLKYRTSKNQRLLVELTLMKLASITFEAEKKKSDYLIPATHFRNQPFTKAPTYSITEETNGGKTKAENHQIGKFSEESLKTNTAVTTETPILKKEEKKEPVKNELNSRPKRVSGLSISSLKAKKDHQNNKSAPIKEEDLPKTAFTEVQMQTLWNEFVKKLDSKGKKILAANLQADVPKLLEDTTTISIELPNSTMKKEVEREQSLMLNFLKEKLQNYDITLQITVNEAHAKKFAFTPEEKYEKLREKNPAIDLLRKEFDLDI
ncbi:DNA polymerase III subunit gamma/tau [uncultured Croceitalea sp.]|uniref:DNA polymerase III subunit gamma/tau n=1 Tax=uncultured Croceitalea sp. TaxID=1798908 RepID=UPI003305AB8C